MKNLNRKWLWSIPITLFLIVYAWFWSTFYFQNPVKQVIWQCFLCRRYNIPPNEEKSQEGVKSNQISTHSATLLPVVQAKEMTDIEIISLQPHANILKGVYVLESSSGKNDGCKKEGKYNGFGYGQNTTVWNCFDSFEVVVGKVNKWFDKYLTKGYTIDEALCLYNTGVKQPMCNYSMKFHTL